MKLYPSSLLTIALYVCSHGMSYPISGLVKSYKAKQYDVEHPLVVGHCKGYNFLRETKDMCWPKCLLYDILNCLRVKPAILNFLQMTTAQDVETSVTVNNNSPIQFTRTIKLNLLMKWLLGSNHSPVTDPGEGPGGPPRPALEKILGETGPSLISGSELPPPPPLSEGVDRHCLQYLCLCLLATWFVCSDYSTSGVSLHGAGVSWQAFGSCKNPWWAHT